ncbi:MAG: hypothetical protein U1F68_11815 [Gammaproteobacteria bacterium]
MTVKNARHLFRLRRFGLGGDRQADRDLQPGVSVHPATDEGVNCTTYTSTDVPKTIGPWNRLGQFHPSPCPATGIADVDVSIVLNHALMADIDAHLRSPAGNDNGLFTDIGSTATGGQTQMDITFDDEAGIPPSFTALKGAQVKPENNSTAGTASTSGAYRLSWFDGENAGGTRLSTCATFWPGANGGTLTAWNALRICERHHRQPARRVSRRRYSPPTLKRAPRASSFGCPG